jgi:xanthine dehydrogenase accessory factor
MNDQDIKATTEQLIASGKPYVVATVVRAEAPTSAKAGDRAILDESGLLAGWIGGGCAKPAVTSNAAEALQDGRPRLIRISKDIDDLESDIIGYLMTCHSGGTLDIFIRPVMPKELLVIIGHTAIAEALCELASTCGYDVTVAAPGGNRERFSGASDWIESFDGVSGILRRPAAIVVATQGSGDARGLESALALDADYIGLIASPKKTARLKEALEQRGCDKEAIARIDGPAGIYIGAAAPEEVAVSVLAELVQRRRLGTGSSEKAVPADGPADESKSSCCSSHKPAASEAD